MPWTPFIVSLRPRGLDVNILSCVSLAGRSRISIVADDGSVLLLALALDAEHRFGAVVAVRDLNADPFAFAVGPGAADFTAVLTDEDLDVLR
jgi:hypothetical protein